MVSVQIAPHLYDIELGFTGFIVRWELQSVEKNRCEVIELLIDGGDHFMRSIQINNERKRIKVEIDNLFFNTMYYFRAYVRNTAGWSAPTVVAIHTLGIEADKAAEKSVQ